MDAAVPPHRWLALTAINLGNFVTPLDTGIMALILPTIASNMRAPVSVVLWVPLTSLLIEAAFMPVFGRYSDSKGRKKYFIVGLVLFSIGAFLAGNSLTIYELILYRIVQSLGAAFVLANGRAMIADAFKSGERGFALGTNVATLYVAITIGTVITASIVNLTQVVGWRYVFYFSGAVAAIDIPLCMVLLRESPKNPARKMDWIGTILFVLSLGSILTLLTEGGNGLSSINIFIQEFRIPLLNIYYYPNVLISVPLTLVAGVAVASTALFAVRELRFESPLIDFGMFRRNTMFLSTNGAALFLYIAHWSTLTLLSFYLEQVHLFDIVTAGFILTVEPLFVTIFALVGGWITSRTGSRDPSIVGMAIAATAMALLTTITPTSSIAYLAVLLAMLGVGVGIFAPSNTNANLSSVEAKDRGLANGILGMMRFTGQSLSLALGTLIVGYVALGQCVLQGCVFTPDQYVGALRFDFGIGFAAAVVGVLFAYFGREKARAMTVEA